MYKALVLGALWFSGCSSSSGVAEAAPNTPRDAGVRDSGVRDAGASDAGARDAGVDRPGDAGAGGIGSGSGSGMGPGPSPTGPLKPGGGTGPLPPTGGTGTGSGR